MYSNAPQEDKTVFFSGCYVLKTVTLQAARGGDGPAPLVSMEGSTSGDLVWSTAWCGVPLAAVLHTGPPAEEPGFLK